MDEKIHNKAAEPFVANDGPLSLLPQDLLDLTDLLLHFAGTFSALPLASNVGLSVIFPATSLALPFASSKAPFALSLVLDFMIFLLEDPDLTAGTSPRV